MNINFGLDTTIELSTKKLTGLIRETFKADKPNVAITAYEAERCLTIFYEDDDGFRCTCDMIFHLEDDGEDIVIIYGENFNNVRVVPLDNGEFLNGVNNAFTRYVHNEYHNLFKSINS